MCSSISDLQSGARDILVTRATCENDKRKSSSLWYIKYIGWKAVIPTSCCACLDRGKGEIFPFPAFLHLLFFPIKSSIGKIFWLPDDRVFILCERGSRFSSTHLIPASMGCYYVLKRDIDCAMPSAYAQQQLFLDGQPGTQVTHTIEISPQLVQNQFLISFLYIY